MKIVIVDDEKHIIKIIRHYLKDTSDVSIVGEAQSVETAVELINRQKPDLLLLDIELKDRLSFDILQQLTYNTYKIIFITAHQHYALQAIKCSAYDYLLKPLDANILLQTIERLAQEQKQQNLEARIQALEANLQQNSPQRLVLKTAEKYIVISTDDILRLEADNTYTVFYFSENQKVVVSQAIKHYEELLPQTQFLRTHRSHIINISQVKEYIKADGGCIIMNNGDGVPISGNRKSHFMQLLEN